MSQSILKPIIFGVLFGGLAFLMPFFLLKVVFFFLIAGALFRLFAWRRFGSYRPGGYHLAFADRIRNMSEEEYSTFKSRYQHCRGRHGWQEPQTPAGDSPTPTNA